MANLDKNIVITPNRNLSGLPNISITGFGNSSINLTVPDSTTGTLEFRSGITTVFSVNSVISGETFSIAAKNNSNLPSLLVSSTSSDVTFQSDIICKQFVTLPSVGSATNTFLSQGDEGQIVYDKCSKVPKLSNSTVWLDIGRPEIIKDPNTLLLHFDPQNPKSYWRNNIHQGWLDYQSQQANYEVISHNSVKIKDTSTNWIGYYDINQLSTGRWYLTFTAWADTGGSTMVLDNDGINDNQFNASYTLQTYKQTFTSFYDVNTTGNLRMFFRRTGGGNIYLSNVCYYSQNSLDNLANGSAAATVLRGTLNNGVSYEENDGALWFDGSNDSCSFNTFTLGNGNIAWTVSTWVKTYTLVDGLGQGPIFSNSSGGPVYSSLGVNQGKISYWTYYGGWFQKLGTTYVADGKWHQLTWVQYTNSTMDMYVDGVHDSFHPTTPSGNNNPIDRMGSSWAAFFNGAIGQVLIYKNKSLTASEVARNFNATRWRYRI